MKKEDIKKIIEKLLMDIEEEDVGISLLNTFYQNQEELNFFINKDKEKVLGILKKLSDDSQRHKRILVKIISCLEVRCHEK